MLKILPIILSRISQKFCPLFFRSLHYSHKILLTTVYGKTFEGENFHSFHGFSANRESFPLESFAVQST